MPIGTITSGAEANTPSGGSTVLAVPYPAAASGMLVLVLSMSAQTPPAPTGWTQVLSDATTTAAHGGVWIKAGAGEAGSLTLSWTGNANVSGQMFNVPGVSTTTPQDVTATTVALSTTSSSVVLPSLTTVTAGAQLVYFVAVGDTAGPLTVTGPAGSTELADFLPAGTGRAGAVYTESKATAGATGTRTLTLSANKTFSAVMLALRPTSATVSATARLQQAYVALPSGGSVTATAARARLQQSYVALAAGIPASAAHARLMQANVLLSGAVQDPPARYVLVNGTWQPRPWYVLRSGVWT